MDNRYLRLASWRGIAIAFVCLAFIAAGCGSGRSRADMYLENASNYIQQGKIRQAKSEIDAAIRLNPFRSLTYQTIGSICANKLPVEGADAIQTMLNLNKAHKLDRALRKDDLLGAYISLGMCYMSAKNVSEAELAYKKALVISPNNVVVLNDLGYLYAEENIKLNESIKLLTQANKLSPDTPMILDSLGWAQYRLARYDDALHNLRRAVRLDPNEPTLRYHAGVAYAKRKHYIAARIELEKALVLDKTMTDARKLLESLPKRPF